MAEGDDKTSWWRVHSLLNSVNHAWRTPTMHPAQSYDDDETDAIFEAVRAFMRQLAGVI